MPSEAWYVLIVCGFLVIVVALVKGRGLKITKDSVTVDPVHAESSSAVHVGARATISNSTVGSITGVSSSGGAAPAPPSVEVLGRARIEGSRVGDITGVTYDAERQKSPPPSPPPKS